MHYLYRSVLSFIFLPTEVTVTTSRIFLWGIVVPYCKSFQQQTRSNIFGSKIPGQQRMAPPPVSRRDLLQLYKQLLRSCQTYPSKNRTGIYQAIREEWRDHKDQKDETKLHRQISVAYKGLSQLRQFGM